MVQLMTSKAPRSGSGSRISHLGNPFRGTGYEAHRHECISAENHQATTQCLSRAITDPSTTTRTWTPTPHARLITNNSRDPQVKRHSGSMLVRRTHGKRILPNLELSRKTGSTTLDIVPLSQGTTRTKKTF